MTVRVNRSTDGRAPVLTGQVVALIALLDACLVTGYGSMTPAGWTKPYLDTNIAVYRTGTGSRQRYLRVDDTNAADSRVHAFENMTSVSDFSSQFTLALGVPTSTTGIAVKKSSTADATVRAWVIVATETTMYMFLAPAATDANSWVTATTSANGNGQFFFGDFISYRPSDVYNTAIVGSPTTTASTGHLGAAANTISLLSGHYITRSYLGFGLGGVAFAKGIPGMYLSISTMGQSITSNLFPDLITGGVQITPIEIVEQIATASSTFITRGKMKGAWSTINSIPFSHGDIIPGSGALAGKTFLVVAVWYNGTQGRMFVEISNTW